MDSVAFFTLGLIFLMGALSNRGTMLGGLWGRIGPWLFTAGMFALAFWSAVRGR